MLKVNIVLEKDVPKGVKVITNDGNFITLVKKEKGKAYLFTCKSNEINDWNLHDELTWTEYTIEEIIKIYKAVK